MSVEHEGRRRRLLILCAIGAALTIGLGVFFRSWKLAAYVFAMVLTNTWAARHDPRPGRELKFWLPMAIAMTAFVLLMEKNGCMPR